MKIIKGTFIVIGALALIASLMNFVAPKAVHAAAAALVVDVANTPTTAVPVVLAPAASQLYSSSCTHSGFATGEGASCSLTAPPAGKTLFIETVSIEAGFDNGDVVYNAFVTTTSDFQTNAVFIPMLQQGVLFGEAYSVGTAAVRVWVASGVTPSCFLSLNNISESGGFTCNISGYLAPAQ